MSSSIIISGITAITTIQLFDGWDGLSDVFEDVGNLACWIHNQMPENRFLRTSIYALGSLVLLRSAPFVMRRTSFFQYYEQEMLYFHRTNNNHDVVAMKRELLGELKEINLLNEGEKDGESKFPLLHNSQFTILELNMGSGTNSSYYPKGAVVIGTDFLEREKETIENNTMFNNNDDDDGTSLTLDRYIHTRVEELASIPDNSISCVVSFHSLCSARKTDRALHEILRVLMPGGRFYFIEHTVEKRRLSLMWWAQLNFSISLFTVACCLKEVEGYIERAGFSKISVKRKDIDLSRVSGPLKSLVPHVYGFAVK